MKRGKMETFIFSKLPHFVIRKRVWASGAAWEVQATPESIIPLGYGPSKASALQDAARRLGWVEKESK